VKSTRPQVGPWEPDPEAPAVACRFASVGCAHAEPALRQPPARIASRHRHPGDKTLVAERLRCPNPPPVRA
jgi:hypothetical protein